jgi:hypothetical protein
MTAKRPDASTARPFVFLQFPRLGECLEAAVVSLFDFGREAAAGQLPGRQMISDTFAAHTCFIAARIRAGAILQIFLFPAFHPNISCLPYVFYPQFSDVTIAG